MEACSLLVDLRKGMQSSSEQPLVGEERYVTTQITAAKETTKNDTTAKYKEGFKNFFGTFFLLQPRIPILTKKTVCLLKISTRRPILSIKYFHSSKQSHVPIPKNKVARAKNAHNRPQ